MKEIATLKKDREKVFNNPILNEDIKCKKAAIINEKMKNLEIIRFARLRDTIALNFHIFKETMSKSWINMNKDWAPRDLIAALKCSPSEPT